MKCGRAYGSIVLRKRKQAHFKIKKNWLPDEYEYQEPIEPKIHSYKFSTGSMQIFNNPSMKIAPKKHPIINAPRATAAQRAKFQTSRLAIQLELGCKDIMIFTQMLHIIEERYPILYAKIEENFAAGVSFMRKIIAYDKDDRYKRNFFEWREICQTAREKSAATASREYYGTTPNGQKVRLSPSHIKRRCVEIERLDNDGLTYWPMFIECKDLVRSLVRSDPVLWRRYREMEEHEYDKVFLQALDGKRHRPSELNHFYYIRHYDADLYKKQKEDKQNGKRKSKPDGMLDCGPFKMLDFPVNVASELDKIKYK